MHKHDMGVPEPAKVAKMADLIKVGTTIHGVRGMVQGMRQGWSQRWRPPAQQWRFWGTPKSSLTRWPRRATRGDLTLLQYMHPSLGCCLPIGVLRIWLESVTVSRGCNGHSGNDAPAV